MNNQAEKFHQKNGKMIQQLVESLDAILEKFNEGIIPGEPEKSIAMYMLDTYLDCLIKFKAAKPSAFTKISEKETKTFDENLSIGELLSTRESIYLLLRLGREKMIPTDDNDFILNAGKILVEGDYIDEVSTETSENHYYILSKKGEKAVKSKSLMSAIRKEVCTAVLPQSLINDSFKWSDLYVRRVEMLNRYYCKKRRNLEHIIFSLNESNEMVFGCEMNDSEDVEYVFAGVFDEKIDDHILQIKRIVESGKVDRLIILNSSEDGITLLEGEGLNSNDYPQIQYELLK